MKEEILNAVEDAIKAARQLKEKESMDFIYNCAKMISECFKRGNKLIIAGNGGSLCDAAHFAEEFSGFFRKKRKALPAMVLSEPGLLTCVSNDVSYEYVFARGVEAFGKEKDLFIALTTSGNSKNLINAVETAKKMQMETIAFLGKGGGLLKDMADLQWIIKDFKTSDRIQEAHMAAIHIIIEMVEKMLFKDEIEHAKEILLNKLEKNTTVI